MKTQSTAARLATAALVLGVGLAPVGAVSAAVAAPGSVGVAAPGARPAADQWTGPAPTTKRMSATDRAKLQRLTTSTLAGLKGQTPGVWVGIWDPAKGWAIASAGNAQVGGAVARKGDHSRIGSVTKTFTATEILKLVDAGKLRLTDTIGALLPAVAAAHPYVKDVTVEQLLGMRSGIPDYTEVPGMIKQALEHPQTKWTAAQLIEIGLGSATTLGGPTYSNTNYLLLGQIARKVTGKSIFSLVNANVRRLGLSDSRLPLPGRRVMPKTASHGYTFVPGLLSLAAAGVEVKPGSEQTDDVTRWGREAGAMYSTVADLGRWAATGLGLNELSPALAAARLEPHPINGGAIGYGLGIEDYGNGWIGHDGQAIGWESRVAYNPTTGAVFVLLVNETGSLNSVVPIAAHYFPEFAAS